MKEGKVATDNYIVQHQIEETFHACDKVVINGLHSKGNKISALAARHY